jgi:glycopeptide antibiotics resistance protein
MTDDSLPLKSSPAQTSWSNRILLLALAGIFFLTLYPFHFVGDQHSARAFFPFSLNGRGKGGGLLDVFLNVLLFVPFGFGVAEKLRERGKSIIATLALAVAAGALLSYTVEFLQIYIPMRDSGWGDIITNSSGAAAGALLFEYPGAAILGWCKARARNLDSWLALAPIGVLLLFYAGFWCILARTLQKETRLRSWSPDSFLAVGDSASVRPGPPWKGQMMEVDFWNHAVSPELARKITAQPSGGNPIPESLVAYRFSGVGPYQDNRRFLPSLSWTSQSPAAARGDSASLDGNSWLISGGPVPTLVAAFETTGQFALRLLCQPDSDAIGASIVSLSSPSGFTSMELRQYNSSLVFWFRDRVSLRRSRMSWVVPDVFAAGHMRDLLLSFDGANLSLFVNGAEYVRPYELGPGVALAHYVRHVKAAELMGYHYVFYAIVFVPVGCLLGVAWRRSTVPWTGRLCFTVVGLLLSAVLLEWALLDAASRRFSFENICLSVVLAIAGGLWINADNRTLGAVIAGSQAAHPSPARR